MPSKSVLQTALISLRQSGRVRRTRLVTVAVLLAGLAFTTAAVMSAREAMSHESRARFQSEVDRLQATIQRQVMVAEYPLRGLAASYIVMGGMTRDQFRKYVQQRELERHFPGLRGMGLVEPVPAHKHEAFVAGVRKEGLPQFAPEQGTKDEDALIIRYAEPLEAVGDSLGMNLNLHEERLEGARRAIATESTTLSGPVRLRENGREQVGWNMMTPVFSESGQLRAVMGARLVAADILNPIKNELQRRVDFRLYDASPAPGMLLFDSLASDTLADPGTQAIAPHFTTQRSLLIGGRLMTLDVSSTPVLESAQGRRLPWVIGVSGAGLSALMALAALLLLSARDRALSMAEVMTSDLRRMARVVERTSSAVFGLDTEGRITWVNPSFEKLMGLTTDECMGQLATNLPQIAGSDRDSRAALAVAIERREGRRLETASERGAGARLWTDTEVQPTRDARGEVTGFICIASDITRRKEAELRLKNSEHLMRVIADNLPARVSYWDRQGRCRFVNRAFGEFFDRPAHELLDQPLTAGIFGSVAAQLPYARRALAGEAQHFEHAETDARGRVASWQMHYIPDVEDGEVRGFTVLALDVTELRRARDLAVEASQAKSRFLSNMSHEIRTPLNAVMGMLGLLRNTRLDERQLDYTDKASRAARSLLSLLNDILDLSKIEAGKMALAPRPFALDDLLRDFSVVLAGSVGHKELEVLFDVDPRVPPRLVADDLRLRQILINLGSNAVKFTPAGEVVLQIKLLASQGDVARLEVSVSDTGVGIAPENQERVFQDFSQAGAETAREYGGTGLGLGICKRLLWLMGSDLRLESIPGQGSRFWFELSLPVAQDAQAVTAPTSQARKVLVVDDNAHAREVLRAMAESLGWKAEVAESGDRALQMVGATDLQDAYDAVFVDWQMPGRNGWQTCVGLRQLPATAHAAMVVLVSAQDREALSQRPPAELKLLDGFLVKPLTASMLSDSVAQSRGMVAASARTGMGERPLAGLRLLLVEDNPVNQQVASELLADQGARIEIAGDGQQAVDRIRAHGDRLDAVLMDVQMPVMDGRAAARAVREQLNNWQLPIIAMTANALESDRVECLAAGMNDHIGKPFEVEEVVRTILRHARPRQSAPDTLPAPLGPLPSPAAPPMAVPPDRTTLVLDRERAIARLGGNQALYERLLPSFTENLRGTVARLPTLLNTVPQDEAVRLMHTLKGTAATMGAQQLADAAAHAEAHLAGPVPAKPDGDVLRGVAEAIDLTLAALQQGET